MGKQAGSLDKNEEKVKEFIDLNKKDDAVKLLLEMIVTCAKARQFKKAESLREQIIEINSMALNEIIKSAEVIESEKSKAIDRDHKKTWSPIYDSMSDEEINAFYFSLKKAKILPGKMIMKQGRMNNKLFLVDSGILNVIHEQNQAEFFIKEVSKGEPVGVKTFFSISLATTSVIAREPVKLHYLERDTFNKILKKFPGIVSKIESLSSKLINGKTEEILKKKSLERRQHKRHIVIGKVAAYILNAKGTPNKKPIIGILEDISEGGLAFSIRQSKQEMARQFLGRKVLLKIKFDKNSGNLTRDGLVTSVHNQLFNNYTINFKFLKPLSSNKVEEILHQDL